MTVSKGEVYHDAFSPRIRLITQPSILCFLPPNRQWRLMAIESPNGRNDRRICIFFNAKWISYYMISQLKIRTSFSCCKSLYIYFFFSVYSSLFFQHRRRFSPVRYCGGVVVARINIISRTRNASEICACLYKKFHHKNQNILSFPLFDYKLLI